MIRPVAALVVILLAHSAFAQTTQSSPPDTSPADALPPAFHRVDRLPVTAQKQTKAQSPPAQSIVELSETVTAGGRIFVTDRQGTQTEGRFLAVSPDELRLLADGKEHAISSINVGRVEKRDSVWNGMLIGAVPSALIGAAAAGASCSPHCGRDVSLGMLVFGAIGAGVGAAVDSGIHGYSILYGPSLASPNARSVSPVGSLDELWLRVRQGDRISIFTLAGENARGRFVKVSSSLVTLMVDGRQMTIRSTDVLRVTRAGNRYRSGALWGGAIFGTAGLISSVACSGGGCGNPMFVAMFTGSAGALWGAAIGAAIPKHSVVYQPGAGRTVRVMPLMGVGRAGVAFATTF